MRADRLVSMVLLLRQRGRLTADTLAHELEVSTRTVLRDIEALALLIAGSGRGEHALGLGAALAAARRKVVDALPESQQDTVSDAGQRVLVEPATDLLSRRLVTEEVVHSTAMNEVRRAVLAGHRLRIHYAATGQSPQWRTVDPIGLVTVRDRGYLLALRCGEDRTYRLSRFLGAQELPEPAHRPSEVDLEQAWREPCAQFLSDGHITVRVRVNPIRREDLLGTALAVRAETPDTDGWLLLDVTYQDSWHAEWALWQLNTAAEALAPLSLRASLHDRAATLATRHAGDDHAGT